MNRRAAGKQYEQLAKDYLQSRGCTVLEENFRTRQGEIDLIVRDGRYLVFVEVKYRRNESFGLPEESVTALKRARIRRAADGYLYVRRFPESTPCRFDVISILGGRLRWIRGAF